MSIIGKQSNEMVAAKTYCLPSLTYGCEVWNINRSTLHKMNVAWNACFRRIFGGFYRESVKPLQFFCGVLPPCVSFCPLAKAFILEIYVLVWKWCSSESFQIDIMQVSSNMQPCITLHRVSCPRLKSNILFGTCLQTLLSCDGRFIHVC